MPFAHKVISLIFLSHPSTFSSTKVDKVPSASSRKLLTKKNRNDANDDNNAAMTSESSSMKQKNYKTINRAFVSTHLQMTVVLWRNFLLNKLIFTPIWCWIKFSEHFIKSVRGLPHLNTRLHSMVSVTPIQYELFPLDSSINRTVYHLLGTFLLMVGY